MEDDWIARQESGKGADIHRTVFSCVPADSRTPPSNPPEPMHHSTRATSTAVPLQPGQFRGPSSQNQPLRNSCFVFGTMPTAVIPVPWFPSNMMSGASVTSQHQEIMLTQYPFNNFNPYPSPFQRGPPMGSFPAQSSLDTVDAKRCSSYETKMANPKYRWGQFCHQGKQRGLAINISFESYQRLISSPCHYCSQCPSESRIGVDRVSSNLNYDISNCVPCCARCNFMKGSLGYKEFIEHTLRIAWSMTSEAPRMP